MNDLEEKNSLLIYKNKNGNIIVDAIYKDETLWLSQKGMAKVFEVGIPAIFRRKSILKHSGNIIHKEAVEKAESEYEKYRIIKDRKYISSMDEFCNKYLNESSGEVDE